jgi:hypothetical protein
MAEGQDAASDALRKVNESEIERRVYEKLKDDLRHLKFLGWFGGAILAIVIYFHQTIFSFVVDQGGRNFQATLADSISEQRKTVAQIDAVRNNLRTDLEQLLTYISLQRIEIIKARSDFQSEMAQLNDILKTATEARATLSQRIGEAQTTADSVNARLNEIIGKVKDLVENQNAIIEKLSVGNVAPPDVKKTTPPSANLNVPKVRVYLQFAGFSREVAQQISEALKQKGWSMPGEERTPNAVGTNQLRYNPKDVEIANALLADVNPILAPYKVQLKLQPNSIITVGIPEIWIYQP